MTTARNPVVKALAAIVDSDGRTLVQCDLGESFYRLPGGNVEFGESAAAAVVRELKEEYLLPIVAGRLLTVIENQFVAENRQHHEVALVHLAWFDASFSSRTGPFVHVEHTSIQLVWRDLGSSGSGLVPKGLHGVLQSPPSHPVHLMVP